jgi:thiamine-phosphate diphosphorylase
VSSPFAFEPLASPILCAVTDRRRLPILAHVAAAADAGVDWVQIREPDLPAAELYEVVRQAVAEVSAAVVSGSAARRRTGTGTRTGTRIIVNDRLDVALAAGAHGVHLRGTSFDAARARALVAADFLIGRSVHSVDEAVAAEAGGGLDYLVFGTMFPTMSKPAGHPLAGPDALRAAVAACRLPILGIGGITLENVDRIAATGAAGVAAIGLFLDSRSTAAPADMAADIASIRRSFADARAR